MRIQLLLVWLLAFVALAQDSQEQDKSSDETRPPPAE